MSLEREGSRGHKVSQEEWNSFADIARLNEHGDALGSCIRSAYLDMSRTLRGIAGFADAEAWHRAMTDCLRSQLDILTSQSMWNRGDFDAWHRATTQRLIDAAGSLGFPLKVGQAQKWINMSIKNGLALGERLKPNLLCVYDVAHVALDNIVLEGLRRKKRMPRELLRGPWSKLPDYEEYMACQQWIRANLPGIPVEEEFRLWQKGRMGVAPASGTAVVPADRAPLHNILLSPQVVGNAGLYFCCYKLSLLGWTVAPTARHRGGLHIITCISDAKVEIAVRVKALNKRDPVPLGESLDGIPGDFWVIVDRVGTGDPRAFVLLPAEVRAMAHRNMKGNAVSYWLEPAAYDQEAFREAWERIGRRDNPVSMAAEKPDDA
jgi:hypothetical protein